MLGPIKTVGIYVENQEKAAEFYRDKLGFEIRRSIVMGPNVKWIEVAPPGAETCLVLYPKAIMTNWLELKPSVVFHCSDVDEVCKRMEAAGVRIKSHPKQLGFGTFATFLDLDGNEFGMTSQPLAQ